MKKSLTLSQEIAKNLSYYFGKDKRCINNINEGCFYSGKTIGKKTQGCFVGRLLPSKDRVKADKYFEEHSLCNSNVSGLVKYKDSIGIEIPKIISDNVKLFGRLQALHDNDINWTIEHKLSEIGKNYLKEIIENNNLDKKDFEKFLK